MRNFLSKALQISEITLETMLTLTTASRKMLEPVPISQPTLPIVAKPPMGFRF